MIEFIFTGIPILFIWIGIFWMCIGMWHYHTLQYAVKEATGYLAVHGASYVSAAGSSIQIKNVASVLATQAVGIQPSAVNVTFTAGGSSRSCRLDNCKTDSTTWPPTANNAIGTDITIRADIVFNSMFALWTPGSGSTAFSNSYDLPGYSHQQIVF